MAKVVLKVFQKGQEIHSAEFEEINRMVVGRIQSAEIRIDDPGLANVHSMIEIDYISQDIKIIDVSGQEKGTFVNGNKILEYHLKPEDVVKVGTIEFRLFFGELEKRVEEPVKVEIKAPPPAPEPPPKPKVSKTPLHEPTPLRPIPSVKKEPPPALPPKPKPPPEKKVAPPVPPPKPIPIEERTVVTIAAPIPRTTEGGEVIEVSMMVHDDILDVITFAPGETVTIGETLDSSFTLPLEGFEEKGPQVFVDSRSGDMVLHVDVERMGGAIRTKGKLYSLDRAKRENVLVPGGPLGHTVRLGRQDFCKINIGQVTFFILMVPRPPVPPRAPFFDWDPVFKRVVAVVFTIWIVCGFLVISTPVDRDIVAEMAKEKVFQRILIKKPSETVKPEVKKRFRLEPPPPPPPKPKKIAKPKKRRRGGGNEGAGARAAGKEGRRGYRDLPKKRRGVRVHRRSKRKVVSPLQQGLLSAVTTAGVGAQLSTLVSQGGALEKSLEGVGGTRLQSGGGSGGEGLRGTGLGGGGERARISGLGTKGRGAGRVGYGKGAVLGKGRSRVLSIGDEQVIEGQLSKKEIRRVVLRRLGELYGCYQLQLSRFKGLAGNVVFMWVIRPDGRVASAKVVRSSWRYDRGPVSLGRLNSCMVAKIRGWRFPKPRGGGYVTVRKYPFNFSPQ